MLEQPTPEGLGPVEGTLAGAVCENCGPWEGLVLEMFVGECGQSSPCGGRSGRDSVG